MAGCQRTLQTNPKQPQTPDSPNCKMPLISKVNIGDSLLPDPFDKSVATKETPRLFVSRPITGNPAPANAGSSRSSNISPENVFPNSDTSSKSLSITDAQSDTTTDASEEQPTATPNIFQRERRRSSASSSGERPVVSRKQNSFRKDDSVVMSRERSHPECTSKNSSHRSDKEDNVVMSRESSHPAYISRASSHRSDTVAADKRYSSTTSDKKQDLDTISKNTVTFDVASKEDLISNFKLSTRKERIEGIRASIEKSSTQNGQPIRRIESFDQFKQGSFTRLSSTSNFPSNSSDSTTEAPITHRPLPQSSSFSVITTSKRQDDSDILNGGSSRSLIGKNSIDSKKAHSQRPSSGLKKEQSFDRGSNSSLASESESIVAEKSKSMLVSSSFSTSRKKPSEEEKNNTASPNRSFSNLIGSQKSADRQRPPSGLRKEQSYDTGSNASFVSNAIDALIMTTESSLDSKLKKSNEQSSTGRLVRKVTKNAPNPKELHMLIHQAKKSVEQEEEKLRDSQVNIAEQHRKVESPRRISLATVKKLSEKSKRIWKFLFLAQSWAYKTAQTGDKAIHKVLNKTNHRPYVEDVSISDIQSDSDNVSKVQILLNTNPENRAGDTIQALDKILKVRVPDYAKMPELERYHICRIMRMEKHKKV